MLLKLICAAIGTALFGLGYYAGQLELRSCDRKPPFPLRAARFRKCQLRRMWNDTTQPMIEAPTVALVPAPCGCARRIKVENVVDAVEFRAILLDAGVRRTAGGDC